MNYNYFDDSYEEDPFEAVRDALGDQYQDLPPEDIEDLLLEMFEGVEPDDVEDFFKSLSQFGQQAGKTLQKAAPGILQGAISGAAAGSAAGPFGALIGALGGATVGGITSATQQQRPTRPRPSPASRPMPGTPRPQTAPIAVPPGPAPQSSPAAMQLLQALSNPTVLQAIMSMAMGSAGNSNVTVGNRSVPASAFTNLLTQLTTRATAEANMLNRSEGIPEYVMDSSGEFLADPANEVERATLLLNMLNEEMLWDDYDDYDNFEDYDNYDDYDEEDWYFDELEAAGIDIDY